MEDLIDFKLNPEASFKEIITLYKQLDEKQFSKQHIPELTYRTLNYWSGEGLLSETKNDKKWRKFSFIEYVWLNIMLELREIGLDLAKVKKIKDQLLTPMNFKEFEISVEKGFSIEEERLVNEIQKNEKEKVKREFSESNVPIQFKEEDFYTNCLGRSILDFINCRYNLFYIITKESLIFPWYEEKTELYNQFPSLKELRQNHHISISLSNILKNFIKDKRNEPKLPMLSIISDNEKKVLELLRSQKLTSLKIRLREGQIMLLEVTEKISPELESRFIDVILKGGYQNISFSTESGKIQNFERTTKIKMNK